MELDSRELKKMKVSVVLLKDDQIKNETVKAVKRQLRLFLEYKNKNNFFNRKNYINSYKSFSTISPNNIYQNIPRKILLLKKYREQTDYEDQTNIQVQTTLSSVSKKTKFRTPFQILHLKNNTLKNIFDYSRNYPKIPSLGKDSKKKLINLRTYSNYKNLKYQSYLTKPNNESSKYETPKNVEKNNINTKKLFLMKGIKKDIKVNPLIFSNTSISLYKNTLNTINNNENNINLNEISLYKNFYNSKISLKKRPMKKFKLKCYYNKLNLKKISNILKKYTYIDN